MWGERSHFESTAAQLWRAGQLYPDRLAIVSEDTRLSYRELLSRSTGAGARLRAAIGSDRRRVIAISTTKTQHLAICALGAWNIGCAYLPLDPAWPTDRVCQMMTEANAAVLIADTSRTKELALGSWEIIDIDEATRTEETDLPMAGDERPVEANDIAYIIFTSGSTGRPKGVAVTHGNLNHYAQWTKDYLGLTREDRVSQLTMLTFDPSVWEIWPVLTAGGSVWQPERSLNLYPEKIVDYFTRNEITIGSATTVIAESLIGLDWPAKTKLRFLVTGGEALRAFPKPGLPFSFVNIYGPTECTIGSSAKLVGPQGVEGQVPTIGTPLPDTELLILDENLKPTTDGMEGEICIAGAGVAWGYVGRPDLTKERFVTALMGNRRARFYRTGDRGRKLPNGEYEFLGRIDEQVKLRGYRIELNDIVLALRSHSSVSNAAVSVLGEGVNARLVAYVALRANVNAEDLRQYILQRLPSYMAPACYVRMERLPLTSHAKIDRAALPLPDRANTLGGSAEPAAEERMTDLESEIVERWKVLLGVREVYLDDDFFIVGGSSLLAARFFDAMEKSGRPNLPISLLAEASTPRKLARAIAQHDPDKNTPLVVRLGGNGTGTPLFIVHPISGNVLIYRHLAPRLAQPVYGIQARSSSDGAWAKQPVSEMARQYVEAIQSTQAHGPYYLAGFSAGGVVAYEMAHQLQQKGEPIAFLGLIDSWLASSYHSLWKAGRTGEGWQLLSRMIRLNAKSVVQEGVGGYLMEKLSNTLRRMRLTSAYYFIASRTERIDAPLSSLKAEDVFRATLRKYVPPKLSANIFVLRSAESERGGQRQPVGATSRKQTKGKFNMTGSLRKGFSKVGVDPALGWGQLVDGRVEAYDVPGDHGTLLFEPQVETVAKLLNDGLIAADARPCTSCRPTSYAGSPHVQAATTTS